MSNEKNFKIVFINEFNCNLSKFTNKNRNIWKKDYLQWKLNC